MTRQLYNRIILLVFTFGFMVCNGQVKIFQPSDNGHTPKTSLSQHSKLIKTQGSSPSDNINSIIQDKAGMFWFGTTGEGVYRFDGKAITQFTVKDGLSSNMVYCILEDKEGRIWIGTLDGVCFYNGKTFTKLQIPLPQNLPLNKYKNTRDVFSIIQDKIGKLWFATIDGVFIYDGSAFKHFIIDKYGSGFKNSNHNVEKILEDRSGNLWFGGRGNIGVFCFDGKSITNFKPDGDNWAMPLLQDKSGSIWFCNWFGAYRFNGKSFIKNDDLSNGPVTRIIQDKKGNLWFGGGGRGLCKYDGKSYIYFTKKDGLSNNDVWSIFEDKSGNIWIGSRNTELCIYDGKTITSF